MNDDKLKKISELLNSLSITKENRIEIESEINNIINEYEDMIDYIQNNLNNIVDKKTIEIKNMETLLRSSLDSPADMIILGIDKEYNYLFFNNAHKEIMKKTYGKDINTGMNLMDCITSEIDINNSKANYSLALSGVSHSTVQEFGDRELSYYESLYNPIYNDKKEIIGVTAFARNITERMESIKKLSDSEEKLRLVLDSTASGIYAIDENDICTYVNKSTLQLLGYDSENEILGKNMHLLTHHSHEDGSPYLFEDCFLLKSLETDGVIRKDDIIWRKDGTFFPVAYSSSQQIKDGKVVGTVVSFKDISERVNLIRSLRLEHAKSQKYLDIAGVMLMVLDSNGNVTLINKKGCEILEADEKDIIGKNWFESFIPENLVDIVKAVFKDSINKTIGRKNHFENEIITTKGNKRIMSWYNSVIFDGDEKIIGVISSGEDITDKRLNEIALYDSNERFETLFNKAPFGYQSLDINGYLREVNNTWVDILGYKKEEVIGKWFGDFLVPEYRERFKERFEIFKKQGKIQSEFKMFHKNGSILFIQFEGLIGYDDKNQFVQTYCNLNDITKKREVEEKLALSESSLKLAQKIAKIGSWELNLEENYIRASEEAFNIYELESDNDNGIIELSIIQEMVCIEDRPKLDKELEELINNNKPYNINFKLKTGKGNIKYINSRASLFTDSEGHPVKIIGIINDITDIKNKELELEYLSQRDYLTNLYNRRYYFEKFRELDKPMYYPLGVMILDLNGLKIFNDAFGHAQGDIVLKTLGDVLTNSFNKDTIISRFGGDEFAILIPNTSSEELQNYKEMILNKVKLKKVENIEISVAIGYEVKTKIDEEIDEVQKSAENRMYRHKTIVGSNVRSKAINAILQTLTEKFETEKRHSMEVSRLCKKIGVELHLNKDDLQELAQAGLFHDIGKISVPDIVLNKPGKLSDEEFEIIKSHAEIGYQILRAADEYSDLAIHALHHHERWDGKGYPSGMKGEDIPLFSRIICIADAYEAMTSDRPYRDKLSKEYALSEIIKYSGSQFDPIIAKIFVEKVLKKSK